MRLPLVSPETNLTLPIHYCGWNPAGEAMETWRERFSTRLRHLKATEGVTQQQVADRLGVAQSTVAGWLHGRREPETLQQFEKLADAIGVHPAWLLYGVDESEEDHALKQLIQSLSDEHRGIVRSLASSLQDA